MQKASERTLHERMALMRAVVSAEASEESPVHTLQIVVSAHDDL